jgi:hypothetical protein
MSRSSSSRNLGSPPLFAIDDVIGAALLGPDRETEFEQIAPLLEARGTPKADELMGGRYVPGVRAFFDHQYGLDRGGAVPLAPDGVEVRRMETKAIGQSDSRQFWLLLADPGQAIFSARAGKSAPPGFHTPPRARWEGRFRAVL